MTAAELRKLRLSLDLTQQAMADKLGVNRATLNRYERNLWPISKPVGIILKTITEQRRVKD